MQAATDPFVQPGFVHLRQLIQGIPLRCDVAPQGNGRTAKVNQGVARLPQIGALATTRTDQFVLQVGCSVTQILDNRAYSLRQAGRHAGN